MRANERTWRVVLTRTDGVTCRWTLVGTLQHVRDVVKGYVEGCAYDCEWTMTDGEMTIEGKSETLESGRLKVSETKRVQTQKQ